MRKLIDTHDKLSRDAWPLFYVIRHVRSVVAPLDLHQFKSVVIRERICCTNQWYECL